MTNEQAQEAIREILDDIGIHDTLRVLAQECECISGELDNPQWRRHWDNAAWNLVELAKFGRIFEREVTR